MIAPLVLLLIAGEVAVASMPMDVVGDAAAAVDELVRLYHVEPHVAAAAIEQQSSALVPSSQQLKRPQPAAKSLTISNHTAAKRRELQEGTRSSWIWDSEVLKNNPCTIDDVPTPAEKVPAAGSEAVLAAALLDVEPQRCSDVHATNAGGVQPCSYDCSSLAQSYGLTASETTCYIRGATSWPSQLTNQIRTTQDWFYFLPEQIDPTETMFFDVGEGRACVNVTVETLLFAEGDDNAGGGGSEVEVRCLLEGARQIPMCRRHT
jgi:hypothetical protein